VRSEDKEREPVLVDGNAERPMPNARRPISGRSEGQPECVQARPLAAPWTTGFVEELSATSVHLAGGGMVSLLSVVELLSGERNPPWRFRPSSASRGHRAGALTDQQETSPRLTIVKPPPSSESPRLVPRSANSAKLRRMELSVLEVARRVTSVIVSPVQTPRQNPRDSVACDMTPPPSVDDLLPLIPTGKTQRAIPASVTIAEKTIYERSLS
jgi:hypothetical protein